MEYLEIIQMVDGHRVSEKLPAVTLGSSRYQLQGSPGIVTGLAAGDEIELLKDGYRLLKRGGNVCIHIVLRRCDEPTRMAIARAMEALGGWLDGEMQVEGKCLLVCTQSALVTFAVIEKTLDEIVGKYRAEGWMYGNVYDEDGKPLNWWPE